ncbi:MAG: hypothetical protein ACOYXT_23415 [Bacteroidota bacterium]
MKKLEDISKKEVFDVPEGYFDKLPGVIQARIAKENPARERPMAFHFALKYALPAVVLLTAGIFWFTRTPSSADAESILASVETEALVAYLNESEITTDEVLETVEFNAVDLDEIEGAVYGIEMEDEELENIMDDLDENNL